MPVPECFATNGCLSELLRPLFAEASQKGRGRDQQELEKLIVVMFFVRWPRLLYLFYGKAMKQISTVKKH